MAALNKLSGKHPIPLGAEDRYKTEALASLCSVVYQLLMTVVMILFSVFVGSLPSETEVVFS